MKIRLNGEGWETAGPATVTALIKEIKKLPEAVVVEYNGKILPRGEWLQTILKENDVLEIISFVGGG